MSLQNFKFDNQAYVRIIHPIKATTNPPYMFENLKNCEIIIPNKLQTLRLSHLKECRIFVGEISGALVMDDCRDCEVFYIAQQTRLKPSSHCILFGYSYNSPSLEPGVTNFAYGDYFQWHEAAPSKDLTENKMSEAVTFSIDEEDSLDDDIWMKIPSEWKENVLKHEPFFDADVSKSISEGTELIVQSLSEKTSSMQISSSSIKEKQLHFPNLSFVKLLNSK